MIRSCFLAALRRFLIDPIASDNYELHGELLPQKIWITKYKILLVYLDLPPAGGSTARAPQVKAAL
jgi:hypothetical protein